MSRTRERVVNHFFNAPKFPKWTQRTPDCFWLALSCLEMLYVVLNLHHDNDVKEVVSSQPSFTWYKPINQKIGIRTVYESWIIIPVITLIKRVITPFLLTLLVVLSSHPHWKQLCYLRMVTILFTCLLWKTQNSSLSNWHHQKKGEWRLRLQPIYYDCEISVEKLLKLIFVESCCWVQGPFFPKTLKQQYLIFSQYGPRASSITSICFIWFVYL